MKENFNQSRFFIEQVKIEIGFERKIYNSVRRVWAIYKVTLDGIKLDYVL